MTSDDGTTSEQSSSPPPWIAKAVRSGVWTLISAILIVLALLWFANQAKELLRILIVSQLFALALEPATAPSANAPVSQLAGGLFPKLADLRER